MSNVAQFFRFSLAGLFGAVSFIAFAVAAIRFASPLWTAITMSLTVPILLAAVLGALFRLGESRAFWTGMAVFGWGYLVVVLAPGFQDSQGMTRERLGRRLPTDYLLNYLHRQLQKQVPMVSPPPGAGMGGRGMGGRDMGGRDMGGAGPGGMGGGMGMSGGGMKTVGPDLYVVLNTGHLLFAVFFGFLGGVLAKWFYLSRTRPDDIRGAE